MRITGPYGENLDGMLYFLTCVEQEKTDDSDYAVTDIPNTEQLDFSLPSSIVPSTVPSPVPFATTRQTEQTSSGAATESDESDINGPARGAGFIYAQNNVTSHDLESVVDFAPSSQLPSTTLKPSPNPTTIPLEHNTMAASTGASSHGPKPTFEGDLNQENPKQFWYDVEEYLENCDDSTKCKRFKRLLKADSAAEVWYEELPDETKKNWEKLEAAFQAEWVGSKGKQVDGAEMFDVLVEGVPSLGDLLKFETSQGQRIAKHVHWIRETMNLVRKYRVPDMLAEQLRRKLPLPFGKIIPSVKTWDELNKHVMAIELVKLHEEVSYFQQLQTKHEDGGAKESKNTDRQTIAVSNPDELVKLLSQLNLSAPTPVSHVSQPLMYAPPPPQWVGPPAHAFPRYYAAPAPRMTAEERVALIKRNALAPPPNTEEGRALYESQKREWHAKHDPRNERPTESRPYPLTPGTLPVGSEECWRCGMQRHGRDVTCPGPYVPSLENAWRVKAGLAFSDLRRAAGVQSVDVDGPYGQAFTAGQTGGPVFVDGRWMQLVPITQNPQTEWQTGKD
ncbi:hypothetical protein BV20DRAFT_1126008 [Pilatotrama ljubarskyi]|nr:hypothetical protein BV20DRAFT_1126008 [Pilatotrama ljubarskyi]